MRAVKLISTIFLSLLVIFSSTSFMVGLHFCGGQIQNVSMFEKAQPCAMEQTTPPCHHHQSKPCCEDETIVHDAQDLKSDIAKLHLAQLQPITVAAPTILVADLIPQEAYQAKGFRPYKPPLPVTDLTISLQVFLI